MTDDHEIMQAQYPRNQMSKLVVFDVYKTLLDIQSDEDSMDSYDFLSSWLSYKGLRVKPDMLMNLYKETMRHKFAFSTEEYPEIDIGDVFETIVCSIDNSWNGNLKELIEDICLLFRMLTTKSITLYPTTIPVLQFLQKRFRLAIISNTQRLFTLPELRKFDIEKYFNYILFSSDVKVKKPNTKIFTTLLNTIKIETQDVIFVGDNLFDDIWGAQQVGMKTIWVNNNQIREYPGGFKRPIPDRQVNGYSYRDIINSIMSVAQF